MGKRIIFNAEPASDDECISPKYTNNESVENNDEEYDNSTMIITEQENKQQNDDDDNDEQYATMVVREKPVLNEEEKKNENVDIRSPKYIISPLFSDRNDILKEFELNEYIQDNP